MRSRRLLFRRVLAVEALALGRHLPQAAARREARTVLAGEFLRPCDERLRAHAVDQRDRAAGERREAEAEDRADVGLAGVGDDALLHAARGLQRLREQEAVLQVLHGDRVRIEPLAGDLAEPRPQGLRARRGIIVEALAVLAAEAVLLDDHGFEQLLL